MNHTYAMDAEDNLIEHKILQGEGRWFEAYIFSDTQGRTYEVWVDRDGADKIVEHY